MGTAIIFAVLSVCRPSTSNLDERIWALDHGECYESKWYESQWGRAPSIFDVDSSPFVRRAREAAWARTVKMYEPRREEELDLVAIPCDELELTPIPRDALELVPIPQEESAEEEV